MEDVYIDLVGSKKNKQEIANSLYELGYRWWDDMDDSKVIEAGSWTGNYFLLDNKVKKIHPIYRPDTSDEVMSYERFLNTYNSPEDTLKPGDIVRLGTYVCGYEKGDIGVVKRRHESEKDWYIVEVCGRESTSSHKPYVVFRYDTLEKLPKSTIIPDYGKKKETKMENPFKVGDYVYLPPENADDEWISKDNLPIMTPLVVITKHDGSGIRFDGYKYIHHFGRFKPLHEMPNQFGYYDWVVFDPEIAKRYKTYTSVWNKPHVLCVSKVDGGTLTFNNTKSFYGITTSDTYMSNAHYYFRKATADDLRTLSAIKLHEVFPPYRSKNLSVGDTVKVIYSGEVYPSYSLAFGFLGFTNLSYNDCKKGTIGKVYYITTHHDDPSQVIVKVHMEDGSDILITERGLEKIPCITTHPEDSSQISALQYVDPQSYYLGVDPQSYYLGTDPCRDKDIDPRVVSDNKISLILKDDNKIELGNITPVKSITISLI